MKIGDLKAISGIVAEKEICSPLNLVFEKCTEKCKSSIGWPAGEEINGKINGDYFPSDEWQLEKVCPPVHRAYSSAFPLQAFFPNFSPNIFTYLHYRHRCGDTLMLYVFSIEFLHTYLLVSYCFILFKNYLIFDIIKPKLTY